MVTTEMILAGQAGQIAIAAAITLGLCGIATAIAIKSIAAESLYAMVHSDTGFGKFLIMAAIPDTIFIAGFVVAVLIIMTGNPS